jgi:hypothetical protein
LLVPFAPGLTVHIGSGHPILFLASCLGAEIIIPIPQIAHLITAFQHPTLFSIVNLVALASLYNQKIIPGSSIYV